MINKKAHLNIFVLIKSGMFCFSAFQTKLSAVEETCHEVQAKLNQHIQQLQRENASSQDEKKKLTRKIEELEGQLQQS